MKEDRQTVYKLLACEDKVKLVEERVQSYSYVLNNPDSLESQTAFKKSNWFLHRLEIWTKNVKIGFDVKILISEMAHLQIKNLKIWVALLSWKKLFDQTYNLNQKLIALLLNQSTTDLKFYSKQKKEYISKNH